MPGRFGSTILCRPADPVAHKFFEQFGRDRTAEQIALRRIAIGGAQERQFGIGFHALGDDLELQRWAELEDGRG